jgi:ribonuclease HI
MYFDGSLNLEGAGASILFISPQGDHLKFILQIHYKASNNSAEYEALIHGLRIAVSLGIKRLITNGDSKVIIDQVKKACDINGVLMKCILRSEGLELLQEIHGGECGNHAAFANLVGKAFRLGFY